MTGPSPCKLQALRALAEGAEPTLELLAEAGALSVRTLKSEAKRKGWVLGFSPQGSEQGNSTAARIHAVAALLLERTEALGHTAIAEGGKIDKTEIEGLVAIIRSLEKIGEIMRPEVAAKENQIRENEDLAEVLDRINARIIELAKEFAAQLHERECGKARREAASAGMD